MNPRLLPCVLVRLINFRFASRAASIKIYCKLLREGVPETEVTYARPVIKGGGMSDQLSISTRLRQGYVFIHLLFSVVTALNSGKVGHLSR